MIETTVFIGFAGAMFVLSFLYYGFTEPEVVFISA